MYKIRTLPAKKLTSAHQFKMGGVMHAVNDVHPNSYDERVIHAFSIESPDGDVTIIVGKNAKFKVYTLKK